MSNSEKPPLPPEAVAEFELIKLRAEATATRERIKVEREKRDLVEGMIDAYEERARDAEHATMATEEHRDRLWLELKALREVVATERAEAAAVLKKAIADERSACAIVCDNLASVEGLGPDDCAAAIRQRFLPPSASPLPNGLKSLK